MSTIMLQVWTELTLKKKHAMAMTKSSTQTRNPLINLKKKKGISIDDSYL